MNVLGIDFETTGLNPEIHDIIEVGWVLWNTEENKMINAGSFLITPDDPVPLEITQLTGITDDMLEYSDQSLNVLIGDPPIAGINYLVAHNADFEKSFIAHNSYRFRYWASTPWIDTMTDLPYPPMKGKGSLSEICMAHGVFNPMPHRALTDTLAMMQVFAQYDFEEIQKRASSPRIQLVAQVTFDEKDKAKKAGYRWDSDARIWFKKILQIDLEKEEAVADSLQFEFSVMNVF